MSQMHAAVDVELLLDVRGASKTFAGNKALDDMSLQVRSGEVIAIVGHNGSGKSTLIKLLAGLHDADPGSDLGVTHERGLTRATTGEGAELHFIHQDLGLVALLSTLENLDITRRYGAGLLAPFRQREETRRAKELIARFGASFDVGEPVGNRSAAERAVIAIARATSGWTHDRNILLLDEPTEALHGREVEQLFGAMRQAVSRGAGIVFVSHRLDEVLTIADRIVVLRDGRQVADLPATEVTRADLLDFITGGVSADRFRSQAPVAASSADSEPRLRITDLSGGWLQGLDLTVRAGEVVGISGLLGSGREDVARLVFGDLARTTGDIHVDGSPLRPGSPAHAVAAGVAYAPGDRARGVLPTLSVRENLTLPRLSPFRRRLGWLDRRSESAETIRLARRFEVRPLNPEARFGSLSGGNQQKAVLAKWIRNQPSVLLLDEPTQGVDAGSKRAIYAAVADSASAGSAVLVSSSDTEELVEMCERVLVLEGGVVSGELIGADLTNSRLVKALL